MVSIQPPSDSSKVKWPQSFSFSFIESMVTTEYDVLRTCRVVYSGPFVEDFYYVPHILGLVHTCTTRKVWFVTYHGASVQLVGFLTGIFVL